MPERYLGRNIGPYRIMELLGSGGIGFVYKAMDEADDRIYALKILRSEFETQEKIVKRFEREALSMARLDHPNIIKVYHYDRYDGAPYFVMEYLEARELSELIEERGRFPVESGLNLLRQAAASLEYIHDKGIIHRDIKSRNIMITTHNEVKLLDFGLARIAGDWTMLTAAGDIFGTPAYMSPEQIRGKSVDHRTDIYAFGILCYETLTGEVPFLADTPTLLFQKHLAEPPIAPHEIVSSIPPMLSDWILKMLEKNPDRRFQGMHELVAALDFLMGGGEDSRTTVPSFSPVPRVLPEDKETPVPDAAPDSSADSLTDPLADMTADRDFKIAFGHYKQGAFREARRYLEKILRVVPNFFKARALLGQISLEEKNYSSALEHYTVAATINPSDIRVLSNLGLVYKHLGHNDEARKAFESVLELDNRFKPARKNLAALHVSEKDFHSALKEYKNILRIDPNDLDAKENFFRLSKMV